MAQLSDGYPYPEPNGYRSYPGFVKNNPLNNDGYIAAFEGDPWYEILQDAHQGLCEIDPGYNIVQIKGKFGDLCYYFQSTFDFDTDEYKSMKEIIRVAEERVRVVEDGIREENDCE